MSTPNASDIRTWAQRQGLTVSDRGRLPQDVMTAYGKAHSKTEPPQAASPEATKATRSVAPRTSTSPSKAAARVTTASAAPEAKQAAPVSTDDGVLEKRVAELEKQVLSLTERLDAAVTALTKRSRSFSLPKRK